MKFLDFQLMPYSLFDFRFWIQALWFLIIFFWQLNLGYGLIRLILSKKQISAISSIAQIFLSSVVGIAIFTVAGFFLGYLGLRFFQIGVVILGILFAYKYRNSVKSLLIFSLKDIKSTDKILLIIMFMGLILQWTGIVGSGLKYGETIIFNRLQGVDGIFHLSLTQELIEKFPPIQPAASDLLVTNYHYFSDLYVAELSRVFHLHPIHTTFQFVPIIMGLTISILWLELLQLLFKSRVARRLGIFLLFFSGNATFIFTLLLHGTWSFQTPAIDHGVLQFYNVPQAFGRALLIAGLICFVHYLNDLFLKSKAQKGSSWLFLAVTLFAISVGFKVYFAMFAAVGICFWFAFDLLSSKWNLKRHFTHFIAILFFALLSAAIFLPVNSSAGGLFWAPLAWPKIMLGAQNIDWNEWWLRSQVYEATNSWKGLTAIYISAVGVFLIAILGVRVIGIVPPWEWFKNRTKKALIVFLWPASILSLFIGMNTLQASGGANIFNFFVLALIPLTIFTAYYLDKIWERNKFVGLVLVIMVVIISLPRPFHDARLFIESLLTHEYTFQVSPKEQEAFLFINENLSTDAIIQSHPGNYQDYYETPYVFAFTRRHGFAVNQGILASHNQPIAERQELLDEIFLATSHETLSQAVNKTPISHIYLLDSKKEKSWKNVATQSGIFSTIFSNSKVTILGRIMDT